MYLIALVVSIILIAVDQITKYIAIQYLKPVGYITLVDGLFSLTFVENGGAAFGIFQGGRWFFIILTSILLVGICVYYYKLPKTRVYSWVRFSLILIIAGAVGNYIDRFRNGYVVDFFQALFIDFPVFNMADIYVVTGTILFTILLLFFIEGNEKPVEKKETDIIEIPGVDNNV